MKKFVFLVALLLIISIPTAKGLGPEDVKFIPQYVSANESFIVYVDPGPGIKRVSWNLLYPFTLADDPRANMGSFPTENNRFVCYFSCVGGGSYCNLALQGLNHTCGPTPFNVETQASSYNMDITAVDAFGDVENITMPISVSGIRIEEDVFVNQTTGKVTMTIVTSGILPEIMNYDVYYTDNLTSVDMGVMDRYPEGGVFKKNITLDPGEYFIAFTAIDPPDQGGSVVRIAVENNESNGALVLTQCSDSIDNDGDGLIDYPEDPGCVTQQDDDETNAQVFEYEVDADTVQFDLLLRSGNSHEQGGFFITNMGNQTLTGLSAVVDPALRFILNVSLQNTTLIPGQTMPFTAKFNNVQEGIDLTTNVNITSGNSKVGEIPIRVRISIITDTPIPDQQGTNLIINPSPFQWIDEYVTGVGQTKQFTVSNIGNETITNITYATEISGISVVDLPDALAVSSQPAVFYLSLNPTSGRNYIGSVTIASSSGSKTILVNVKFSDNISDDITGGLSSLESTESTLQITLTPDQMSAVAGVISDIRNTFNFAQSSLDNGNYDSAKESYIEAVAKTEALNNLVGLLTYIPPQNGGSGDSGGGEPVGINFFMIIIVVVVIAAIVVLFYFMKIKKQGPKNEEYGEEFEYEEEGDIEEPEA